MTQEQWRSKVGEKIRDGAYLWGDTWCTILSAMVIENGHSHLWTFDRKTGEFKDEKKS